MDFSSFQKGKSSFPSLQEHRVHILKHTSEDGNVRVYQDETGHAERTEISLPEGKVIVTKDYEKVPILAHYKKVIVTSVNDDPLGELSVFPEDRMGASRRVRFFDGSSQIGNGSGDIGMAIAHQLLNMADDPRRTSSIDPEVISTIKSFFGARKQ